jgi:Leucine Rich repeat
MNCSESASEALVGFWSPDFTNPAPRHVLWNATTGAFHGAYKHRPLSITSVEAVNALVELIAGNCVRSLELKGGATNRLDSRSQSVLLARSDSLTRLHLVDQQLSRARCTELAAMLPRTCIALELTHMAGADVDSFCCALQANGHTQLTELDLSACSLGADGLACLNAMSSLRVLRARQNRLVRVDSDGGGGVLTRLEQLDLSWTRCGDSVAKLLFDESGGGGRLRLRSLQLAASALTVRGVRALHDAVVGGGTLLSSLQRVDLFDNRLGADSAALLARCCCCAGGALQMLVLDKNNIGCDGCEALADALGAPTATLTALNVRENNVRSRGLRALASRGALHQLVKLDAHSSRCDDDAALAIAEALGGGGGGGGACRLEALDLGESGLAERGAAALADAIAERNGTLTKLHVNGNVHVQRATCDRLNAALARNRHNRLQRAKNLQRRCFDLLSAASALDSVPPLIVDNMMTNS